MTPSLLADAILMKMSSFFRAARLLMRSAACCQRLTHSDISIFSQVTANRKWIRSQTTRSMAYLVAEVDSSERVSASDPSLDTSSIQ